MSETSQEQALRAVDDLVRIDVDAGVVDPARVLNNYITEREERISELESVNADLYEALRLAVINWLPHDSIYAPEARAALAKARGEEPPR